MGFYYIRAVQDNDVPFLWDMLYEISYARSLREGKIPPAREILDNPDLAKYVKNWGQIGDRGFMAIATHNQAPIGAAWYRLYQGENKAFGYVDDETPELAIALLSKYTGKGIGGSLLAYLLHQAQLDGYQQISLNVDPKNTPAFHLYQKLGFEKVGVFQTNWIMKKVLI
jgi:ribosomal protein S18 acetylase RimI-like enzyme